MAKLRVAVSQMDTKLGLVEQNVEKTAEIAMKAYREGARICLFPELNLTGYYIQDITFEVALKRSDERLKPLFEVSNYIDLIVGAVEESEDGVFYNSAFFISEGDIKHVHRKVYLPTYGMFDEARFVGSGKEFNTFKARGVRSCVLICEDLWHISSVYLAFVQGAKFIFAQSASPGRGYRDRGMFGNAEVWSNMGEFYARLTTSYFFYANRVGVEDGFVYSGNSFVADPYGRIIARAGTFEEELLIVDAELALIRSARVNLPLLRDEKFELFCNQINKLREKGSEAGN